MPDKKKMTVELPEYLINQITFWAKKFDLTGSEMIMYFCRLGIAQHTLVDTSDYLNYLSRKKATAARGNTGGNGE